MTRREKIPEQIGTDNTRDNSLPVCVRLTKDGCEPIDNMDMPLPQLRKATEEDFYQDIPPQPDIHEPSKFSRIAFRAATLATVGILAVRLGPDAIDEFNGPGYEGQHLVVIENDTTLWDIVGTVDNPEGVSRQAIESHLRRMPENEDAFNGFSLIPGETIVVPDSVVK
jgi:hypothetical protein